MWQIKLSCQRSRGSVLTFCPLSELPGNKEMSVYSSRALRIGSSRTECNDYNKEFSYRKWWICVNFGLQLRNQVWSIIIKCPYYRYSRFKCEFWSLDLSPYCIINVEFVRSLVSGATRIVRNKEVVSLL